MSKGVYWENMCSESSKTERCIVLNFITAWIKPPVHKWNKQLGRISAILQFFSDANESHDYPSLCSALNVISHKYLYYLPEKMSNNIFWNGSFQLDYFRAVIYQWLMQRCSGKLCSLIAPGPMVQTGAWGTVCTEKTQKYSCTCSLFVEHLQQLIFFS